MSDRNGSLPPFQGDACDDVCPEYLDQLCMIRDQVNHIKATRMRLMKYVGFSKRRPLHHDLNSIHSREIEDVDEDERRLNDFVQFQLKNRDPWITRFGDQLVLTNHELGIDPALFRELFSLTEVALR